jgi:hypothetical protein
MSYRVSRRVPTSKEETLTTYDYSAREEQYAFFTSRASDTRKNMRGSGYEIVTPTYCFGITR